MFSLLSEGFRKEEVLAVLDNSTFSSSQEILKKELEKFYIKLSRKYDGTTLQYQLKMKLLSRGFEIEALNEVLEEFFS